MKKSMKLYMKIINNERNIERYFVDGMELNIYIYVSGVEFDEC
jgi:hypothetical protein